MDKKQLEKYENYSNRELSWLQFNYRILGEAKDKTLPLFERLKFLGITASNLDEFFMIRVASLIDLVHAGVKKKDIAGLTPEEQLEKIIPETKNMMSSQYMTLNRSLLPAMEDKGLKLVKHYEDLTEKQERYVDKYFHKDVYPVLTPMAVDSSRPFPLISNKTLNIGALIRDKKKDVIDIATVQVPSVLPRIVELPAEGETREIILLEEIIEKNLGKLFLNYEIVCAHPYRIMRNADLAIDEDDAADLLKEIEKQIKKRAWGEVIKLEVETDMDRRLLKELKKQLQVSSEAVYAINGPLDLTFLMKVSDLDGFEHLCNKKYIPQPVKAINHDENIFDQIKRKDILLHHPYDEFTPVIQFIKQAAVDPNVLAIKQTLYRVSGNSPIVAALAQAAENGKQVTVLVELKARFDEENNINWAKMLEKAGCHVIYGLVGLKTHSKIALVVRREEEGIKRYVHLGTGNYNDITAKLYTDMGMLTASDAIGEDATAVFNMLSGYSEPLAWNKLLVAPIWMKNKFVSLIRREAENARMGKEARIIAKMNSLCDPVIISALYEASNAGVKIDLIVRGICCLKTGIHQLSENITVRSIVGNFLEHSRIFYFYNGGFEDVYMGSADWMPRNLDKRVEITFPVEDEDLKRDVIEILNIQLADTLKAYILKPDGSYEKQDLRGRDKLEAQAYFCKRAMNSTKEEGSQAVSRVFIPRTSEK
ncbi:MAG: RNA degradosome polyphosphate kinase [Clostridium sp.]|nr:RNA degradosome polyphosphate kinase [Clostridium sp.]MCM1400140.1 RNA degradosome polyphosphate kinase [Clostridium sp.]MCM1460827.1 RNA degradosome polyphosphate kinase [Bacteroides sp.]